MHKRKLESKIENRIRSINKALYSNPVDIVTLEYYSVHGGLVNNAVRSLAWPKLLGIDQESLEQYKDYVRKHQDSEQVQKDIERSLWKFTEGKAGFR